MKKIILILVVALCSCEPQQYIIDSRIQPYVDEFFAQAAIRGVYPKKENLVLRLEKNLLKNNGSLGESRIEHGIFTNEQEIAVIDEDFFLTYSKSKVECVIFHELGHTLLNRRYHENQIPSVMNLGSVYMGYCYGGYHTDCEGTEEQRKVLLDELFRNR